MSKKHENRYQMDPDCVLIIDKVSKKFSRNLKKSMIYGIQDIARNILGMRSPSQILRPKEFWALDDVSLRVNKGESIGIIGPNGSGKTTLLKLINGIFWPDRGLIKFRGKIGPLISVGAGFHPLLTGRENIYVNAAILGMTKAEVNNKFDEIVAFADISDFLDTPVKFYSSGMFVRLGFSIAVHCRPDILIIDEVLAVGDEGFQKKCFNKIGELKQEGVTTILVSHNMHLIMSFTEKVMLIHNGIDSHFDNVSEGIAAYRKIFRENENMDIEKIISGTDKIKFSNVKFSKRKMKPGEDFQIQMDFHTSQDYENIKIDLNLMKDGNHYFQGTNILFDKKIDFKMENHRITIIMHSIPIINSPAWISVSIWSEKRRELLFWWRIPIEFDMIEHTIGRNLLKIGYEIE